MIEPTADQGISNQIHFFKEEGGQLPSEKELVGLRQWILDVAKHQGGAVTELNYIFCGDDYLLEINKQYLQHDYFTDIITFPSAPSPQVSGDIFISVDRVAENAKTYQSAFQQELRRVIIHGVLHLCGQGDKTEQEAAQMRAKEEQALKMADW